MIRYHHEFPDDASELSVELACFRANLSPEVGGLGTYGHFKKARELLMPATLPNGQPGYNWHHWSDRRFASLCDRSIRFQTWWGPSASGKTTDAAIYALLFYLAAPELTTVIVVSTTRAALEKRVWSEITRFITPYLDSLPVRLIPSETAIRYMDPKTGKVHPKFGIFGVAIQNATLQDAIGNLIGVHPPRLMLIIDEMQTTKEAAVGAIPNLSTAEEFQFLGMGNPYSHFDQLVLHSEPLKGWTEHPKHLTEWPTKFGRCLWFDGLDSPAVIEPDGDKRHPYLLKQRDIDDAARWWGPNSPMFWSQRRGYVPPEGLIATVLSEAFIYEHRMMEKEVWRTNPILTASVDPAFSTGGDRCMLSFQRHGKQERGTIIEFEAAIQIYIEPEVNETVTHYLARRIREACQARGIDRTNLAIDCSGTQIGLADCIDMDKEWKSSGRCHRVYFGGKPSERIIASDDPRLGTDVYKNRVSELWYRMYHFGRFDQIRGLTVDDCKEFCSRQIIKQNPIQIMSKTDMPGNSPDLSDSRVVGLDLLCTKYGIIPGTSVVVQDDTFKETVDTEEKRSYLEAHASVSQAPEESGYIPEE